jgi:hypothetical protein
MDLKTVWEPKLHLVAACSCREWTASSAAGGTLRSQHATHVREARAAAEQAAAEAERFNALEWFRRTGHCGKCGNPGSYCTCTTPCGCADQHEVGSGLGEDALDQFATGCDQRRPSGDVLMPRPGSTRSRRSAGAAT